MRIANVESNTLNCVPISSAGSDISARSAPDEMRHGSEPDVIKGQYRDFRKKDKDHLEFLCELYEAQVARVRYYVH